MPTIHQVFGLAKRWLLGPHHGAVSKKHLAAYLDEFVFRFDRRPAKNISHRFGRLIEHAVQIHPTTYRTLVTPSPEPRVAQPGTAPRSEYRGSAQILSPSNGTK